MKTNNKPTKEYLYQHAALYSGTNNQNNMKNEKTPFPTEENQPQPQNTPTPPPVEESTPFTDDPQKTRYYIDARYKDGGFKVHDAKQKKTFSNLKKKVKGDIVGACFFLWTPKTAEQKESGARPYVGLRLTLFNVGEYASVEFKLFHVVKDSGVLLPELTYSGLLAFNSLHALTETEGKNISMFIETKTTNNSRIIGRLVCFIDKKYQSLTKVITNEKGEKSTVNIFTGEQYAKGISKKQREKREQQIFKDLCTHYGLNQFVLDGDGTPLDPLPDNREDWYKKIDTTAPPTPPQEEQQPQGGDDTPF